MKYGLSVRDTIIRFYTTRRVSRMLEETPPSVLWGGCGVSIADSSDGGVDEEGVRGQLFPVELIITLRMQSNQASLIYSNILKVSQLTFLITRKSCTRISVSTKIRYQCMKLDTGKNIPENRDFPQGVSEISLISS